MSDPNRFLRGPFAPVEEEITAFDLPVTGRLPAGLNGRYLRNGPNPLGLDDPSYRVREGHWFLGPGMVHGVRLRDGKAAWYRNRWVRSRQASHTATATAPSSARSATPRSDPAATSPTRRSATPCSNTTSARAPSRRTNSGKNATAGEAVFVPATPAAAEDDGYVMAFIHNPDRGAADLVLLAAQDFTAEPIARVHLPARIPLGFHGSWIPDR